MESTKTVGHLARFGELITARKTWLFMTALVLTHEFVCPPGELLSDGVDRGLQKHPVLVYGFTAVTVAHLLNWLPPKLDPYAGFGHAVLTTLKGYR